MKKIDGYLKLLIEIRGIEFGTSFLVTAEARRSFPCPLLPCCVIYQKRKMGVGVNNRGPPRLCAASSIANLCPDSFKAFSHHGVVRVALANSLQQ